jgi:hypothetical protein
LHRPDTAKHCLIWASGGWIALALAILPLNGCTLFSRPRPFKGVPFQASQGKFGTIIRINSAHSFVLIQKEPSALLPEWEGVDSAPVLWCGNPKHPKASLRLSPESRRNLVIADVLEGKPTLGDSVFFPADPGKTPEQTNPVAEKPSDRTSEPSDQEA